MDKVPNGPDAAPPTVDYGALVGEPEGGMIAPAQKPVRQANGERSRSTRSSLTTAIDSVGTVGVLLSVATVVVALAAIAHGPVPAASGLAVALLVPAALVDFAEQRLPDPIVAAAAVALVVGLVGADVATAHVVLGAVALAGPILGLHLLSPASMGFGDVKAAAVLGGAVGAVHWQLAVGVLALAAGTTACTALIRRVHRISFGPGLVAAAAVGLAAHRLLLAPRALDELANIGYLR